MQDFFSTLFDFSFSEFVTTKIIKVIYGIGVLFAGIVAIAFIVKGFNASAFLGILALIVSPVVFIIYIILIRVWLEVVIVLFKISEDVQNMAKSKSE